MFGIPLKGGGGYASVAVSEFITSKQSFSILLDTSNQQTNTATISSVDKDLSCILWRGNTSPITSDDADDNIAKLVLTNGTTVTMDRGIGTTLELTGYGDIIEFDSAFVTKVHHGTVSVLTGNFTAVSSSFNAVLANCSIVWNGTSTPIGLDSYDRYNLQFELTGSDGAVTVTATKIDSSGDTTGSFSIIEWKAAKINSIQEVNVSMSTSQTSNTATISSVDTDESILFWNGWNTTSSGTDYDEATVKGVLTNATTVTASRDLAAVDVTSWQGVVVEFVSSTFTSVESLQPAMGSGETQDDVTLGTTLTDTSKAMIVWGGFSTESVLDQTPDGDFLEHNILNTTTVRSNRNTSGWVVNTAYQVIQT